MASKRLLTTIEVANWLGIPVSTIYRWQYVGTGPPAIRIGRHLRFDADDLEHWINDQRNDARSASRSGIGADGGR
jgi:excisionase family DNA binding protein